MKHSVMFFLLLGLATAAGAQQMGGHGMAGDQAGAGSMMGSGQSGAGQMGAQGMMAPGASPMADGEIRKVNKGAQKLTIRHGEIPHMDMPPMTMVYRVSDPAMLDRVKAGDKVKFAVEKIGGGYVVTKIEVAK